MNLSQNAARRSRNQSRAMAVPAMLEHGRDPDESGQAARGTKSLHVTKNLGISSTGRKFPPWHAECCKKSGSALVSTSGWLRPQFNSLVRPRSS